MSQALLIAINRKKNLRIFLIVGFVLILVLLSFYIFQASLMIKGTSFIKDYENKIYEFNVQNKNLEIVFSKKNSLKIDEILLKELNFEKITKIDYIRILEPSVAAK